MDDESEVVKEELCYKKLSVSQPSAIISPDENVQLPPIIQPIAIAPTVSNPSFGGNANGAPYGGYANGENVNQGGSFGQVGAYPIPEAERLSDGDLARKKKRKKNLAAGIIMLISSLVVLLPFVFAVNAIRGSFTAFYNIFGGLSFFGSLDVFDNLVLFFANTSQASMIWKSTIPSFIIAIGLLFVVLNMVVALIGIFGGVKGRKYVVSSLITFFMFLLIAILSLIGVDAIGLAKVGFQDVIANWKQSQLVALLILGLINVVCALVCAVFTPKKPSPIDDYGYRRR